MRFLVLVCILALASAGPARAERYLLEYRGAVFGVFGLGDVTLDISVTRDRYQMRADLESGGLLALFERTDLTASSSGFVTRTGAVEWRSYSLDHHYSRKHRVVEMRRAPGELDVTITPNYREWGDPPASDQQRFDSRDPLASLMAMSVHVARTRTCAGDYDTFDGRFHYRLELRPGRYRERVRGGGYDGPVMQCRLRYVPVSGFEATDSGRRNRIPVGEIWFALIDGAEFAPPVRAFTPLPIGRAGVRLRRIIQPTVTIGDAP